MLHRNKKLSPSLKHKLSDIPQHPQLQSIKLRQRQSNQYIYDKMQHRLKNKSRSINNSTQYITVRSKEQKQLMNNLRPRITPLLSPTNSISISEYLKFKSLENTGYHITDRRSKSSFLPVQKTKNSQLDNILQKKQKFMKTYFNNLKQFKRKPSDVKEKEEISYQFPQVITNGWRVTGFLRGGFVLLKGLKKQDNYLPPKEKFKKYPYANVWNKIRNNYQQWVNDRFCFQN